MENMVKVDMGDSKTEKESNIYVPFPGADAKYIDEHRDWKIYNPEKYRDPNWSPDKE